MPLYDFECVQCGHPFEAFLKMSDSGNDLPCPQCGAKNPGKLVSLVRSSAWSTFLDKMERKVSPEKFK
jgi:putative FmdB family regulatory protein